MNQLEHLGLPRAQLHAIPVGERLQAKGFDLGAPVLLRLFKSESLLEVWMERGPRFELAMAHPICKWSGALGPKLKEGDGQSPEGFYAVGLKNLKPDSDYHRAINIGFPNAFDEDKGRTGSFLMIHGSCVSIGCYAITDKGVDDVYTIVEAALHKGQQDLQIQIYPFLMNEENLMTHAHSPWIDFWRNLSEGEELFQLTRLPLDVHACRGRYDFAGGGQCTRITAW